MELEQEIKEFLIECHENLANLDQEIVHLENRPTDADLLGSIFRTFHTIKGTCGFFGFTALGSVTHGAENLLDQIRSGRLHLSPALTALFLECVDFIHVAIRAIEQNGEEGELQHADLSRRLEIANYPSAAQNRNAHEAIVQRCDIGESETEAAPQDSGPIRGTSFTESTIRVHVGLLDKLMNLVGELVLARNQLIQGASEQDNTVVRTIQRLNVVTSELQEGVLKTRMQPIHVVWNKLPRVVRDLAAECGKTITLHMEGADTELDKTIIESIKDPITHIVRNACDHGVESPEIRLASGKSAEGKISMRAYHEGGQVNIEIADDGRGLDPEKLKARAINNGILRAEDAALMSERDAIDLVFHPGFSTAEKITTISGRGVGMDVVKTNIQKIGGTVDIANASQHPGSVVKIKIPLTLAIIPGLVIQAMDDKSVEHRFLIPQASLLELVRIEQEDFDSKVEFVHGSPVYRRRGQLLPLAYLDHILGFSPDVLPKPTALNIVVLQTEDRPFGLVVDGIYDTQEIVVKPLGKLLKGLRSYLGATIMGDGRVAIILDVPGLSRLAGMSQQSCEQRRITETELTAQAGKESFLLFRSENFLRIAVPLSSVSRLEQIERSKIDYAAGHPVLQYRNQILPLMQLSEASHTSDKDAQAGSVVQVIVFGEGSMQTGLLVTEILDIVEESITFHQGTSHPAFCGSAILGGVITDLLNIETFMQSRMDRFPSQPIGVDSPTAKKWRYAS